MRRGWSRVLMAAALTVPMAVLAASDRRNYAKSTQLLEVGGMKITDIKEIKTVENTSNSQVKVTMGLHMGRLFSTSLSGALAGKKYGMSDLAVLVLDFNHKVQSQTNYVGNVHFTDITLPAADASSKDAGYIDMVLQADQATAKKGDGKTVSSQGVKQKIWRPNDFRLNIAGFGTLAKAVHKTSPIHASLASGPTPQYDPWTVTLMPKSNEGASVQNWFNAHKGRSVLGTLDYLDPSLKRELAQIKLEGLVPEQLSQNGNSCMITFSIKTVIFTLKDMSA